MSDETETFNMNLAMAVAKKKKSERKHGQHASSKSRQVKSKRKASQNQSLRDFVQAAFLYGLCLALPTLLGVVVRFYDSHMNAEVLNEMSTDETQPLDEAYSTYYYNLAVDYMCETTNYWCPEVVEMENATDTTLNHLAPDTAVVSDAMLVTVFSLSLAFIRIALVHFFVPKCLETPQRLEALVRCKSAHLLSSSYPLTPKSLQRSTITMPSLRNATLAPLLPLDLDNNIDNEDEDYTFISTDKPYPQTPPNEPVIDQVPFESNPHEIDTAAMDDDNDQDDDKDWLQKTKEMLHSGKRIASWSSLVALGHEPDEPTDQQDIFSPSAQTEQPNASSGRLFAAPRLATAVFRLLYSVTSCLCAMVWFRTASFWPPYVFGRAGQSTLKCWDLKGGLGDLDTDFDLSNAVLKRYFILQASYHLHSLCFHVVSVIIYLIKSRQTKRSSGFGMANWTSGFIQHSIAVVCLCGAYFFSSLRRLGAICMFALDFSSVFLHLLQLCINAPSESIWNNKTLIIWVHKGLVVPTFLYSRFFILPFVVWYSAVFESRDWLQQLERTLFVGCAHYTRIVFHCLLATVMVLNLVLFRRLLFHPHLAKIIEKDNKSKQTKLE